MLLFTLLAAGPAAWPQSAPAGLSGIYIYTNDDSEIATATANGFGPTSVPVVSGSETQSGMLSPAPLIQTGGAAAQVPFAGLVAPGEFQFNVVVPGSLANGDQPIAATYNGPATQAGTPITIQH
jgi:uncharacterized protein (TIGR03437 family)